MVGVRDGRSTCPGCGADSSQCTCPTSGVCPSCGGMPIGGECMCEGAMDEDICAECGMMYTEGEGCGCTHLEEAKKKGPSKKTAQKILRGTKTFKEKMKKVEKWADDPAAAAAWMMKRATGKYPSQE